MGGGLHGMFCVLFFYWLIRVCSMEAIGDSFK